MELKEAKIEGRLTEAEVNEAIAEYLKRKTGKEMLSGKAQIEKVYDDDDWRSPYPPTPSFVGYAFTLKG